jgi:two-component system OmpR family sensor kinase
MFCPACASTTYGPETKGVSPLSEPRVEHRIAHSQRALELLEALLRIPAGDMKSTLAHAADLVARATGADKVDGFLYDPSRDSLVAVGTSTQPLSMLQRQLGLDVLQLSNGGRVVHVYKTGETFLTGHLDQDPEELRGVKEGLGIRSKLGVPLDIGGRRRGMMMIASLKPDFFTEQDARFAETMGNWIGVLAHRAELAQEMSRNAEVQGRRAAAEELITVLAHDLRNYLSPLHMRLEMLRLRAKRDGRDDDARDADAASRAVLRLGGLVSDILDVARIEQGVFRIEPQACDLGALVRETATMLATNEHPVRVTVEEGRSVMVNADAGRLRQCVENIIANAIQKSPASAAVSVFVTLQDARPDGAIARVEVIDEGPGIPPELLPHVFERFVSGGKGGGGGLGLGLYLAKRIAGVHGGDLSVDSQPGKGARFTLTLPLAAESGATPRAAP